MNPGKNAIKNILTFGFKTFIKNPVMKLFLDIFFFFLKLFFLRIDNNDSIKK
jgi:hypothetical protein